MKIKNDRVDLINKVTTLRVIKCWYPKDIVRLGRLSYIHNAIGKDIATVKYGTFDYLYSQKGGLASTVEDSYCDRFIETGYFADKNKDRYPILSLGIMECYDILSDISYFYHHIFNSKLEQLKGSEAPKNIRKAFRRCLYDYSYRCDIHNSVVAVKKIVNIYTSIMIEVMDDVYKVAGRSIDMIEKHGLFDIAKEYIKTNKNNPFCTECEEEYAAFFAYNDAITTLAGLGEAFRDAHCGSKYVSKGYDVKFTVEPADGGYVLRIKREKKDEEITMLPGEISELDMAKQDISYFIETNKDPLAVSSICSIWKDNMILNDVFNKKCILMQFNTICESESFVQDLAKHINSSHPNNSINSAKDDRKMRQHIIIKDSDVIIDLESYSERIARMKDNNIRYGLEKQKEDNMHLNICARIDESMYDSVASKEKEPTGYINQNDTISSKKDIINTWMNSKDYSAELIIDTAKNHYFVKNLEAVTNPRNAFEEDEHVIEAINAEFNDVLEMYGFITYLAMVIENRFHTKAEKWSKDRITISSDKKSIYFDLIKDGVEEDSVKEFNNDIIAKAIEEMKAVDRTCPYIHLLRYVMCDKYDNEKAKKILYNLIGSLNATKSGMVKSDFILDAYLRHTKKK